MIHRPLVLKTLRLLAFVALALALVPAQSTPATIYTESFRQGATKIVEQKFEVKLSPQTPTFHARIQDSRGQDRYALSIDPQGPEGDTTITSWQVKLIDLEHRFYDNILLTSRQPSDASATDPKNTLWRLDPSVFARVPANAVRIIKVDGFYVILQIKSHHDTPIDSPYLDSMTVALEFTNTDPRPVENVTK